MRYNEITRRYFEAAPGAGILTGEGVFRGAAGSREQGTWVQFDLKIVARPMRAASTLKAASTISAARFLCYGCPHTIAISAWVAEAAVGRGVARELPEDVRSLSARFELPPDKLGRVLTIEDAWVAAVARAVASAA
jgi:hypothetical protein